MQTDLTYGTDGRGDYALFIDEKHVINGWSLDEQAQEAAGDGATFFRLIDEDGEEMSSHGWIEDGSIVQWG